MSEHSSTSAALMLLARSCARRCTMRSAPLRSTCTLMPGCTASKALANFSAVSSSIEVYQTTVPSCFALAISSGLGPVGSGAAASAEPAMRSTASAALQRRDRRERRNTFISNSSPREGAAVFGREVQAHRAADRDVDRQRRGDAHLLAVRQRDQIIAVGSEIGLLQHLAHGLVRLAVRSVGGRG